MNRNGVQLLDLTIVLRHDPSLTDWVAHCLDFDVCTQGRSLDHAIAMLAEAVLMTWLDDYTHGLSAEDRRAPREYWDEAEHVRRHGRPIPFRDLMAAVRERRNIVIVAVASLFAERMPHPAAFEHSSVERLSPEPWAPQDSTYIYAN